MFKHGADLEKIKRKYHIKGELVDFSSNINPFTPEDTVIHIIDEIEDKKISRYRLCKAKKFYSSAYSKR